MNLNKLKYYLRQIQLLVDAAEAAPTDLKTSEAQRAAVKRYKAKNKERIAEYQRSYQGRRHEIRAEYMRKYRDGLKDIPPPKPSKYRI